MVPQCACATFQHTLGKAKVGRVFLGYGQNVTKTPLPGYVKACLGWYILVFPLCLRGNIGVFCSLEPRVPMHGTEVRMRDFSTYIG